MVRLTMNFRRPSFKSIGHIAFVAAAAAILTCGWVLYGASVRTTESTRWVSHTLEVIKAFHEVDEQISRAESAQRGYLLTTAETFLEERDQALAAESVAVIAIKELTTDNKDQQRRVSRLEKLNAQRISIMHENERRLQTEGSESVRTRIASGVGRAATKAIYDLTNDMEQEEMRLLEVRRAAERQRHESAQVALFAALFISVAVLIPGYLGFIVNVTRVLRLVSSQRWSLAWPFSSSAIWDSSCSPAHAVTPSAKCSTWLKACPERPTRPGRTPTAARSASNL